MDFPTVSSRVLDDALQMGAVSAEVYVKTSVATELKMYQGKVESLTTAEEEGLGIRFQLPGGRWGYGSTSDLSAANVEALLEEAVRGAGEGDGEENEVQLPGAPEVELPTEEELGIWAAQLPGLATGRKLEMLRAVEAEAQAADPRVCWVDTLLYQDGWTEVHLRNSNGFEGSYRRSAISVALQVLARDDTGRSLMSHHVEAVASPGALDPKGLARRAAQRAVVPLGGRRIGPKVVTVVLEPPVAARLLEHLAPSLLATSHQGERSLLQGMVGERVASELVNIVDDGRLPGGLGTAPFDAEGTPSGRTSLIEDGVLRRTLHDSRTAARAGTESTGNASRISYRQIPEPGVTNLCLEPGETPTPQILLDVDEALQVVNLTSVGGINPVTGFFSAMASGVWVERGKEKFPVSGVTITGDLRDMLARVVAVGNDPAWHHGAGVYRAPTLVIDGLTVAG